MAFTVIYDACVLYPAPLRDLLIRVGMLGIVRVRWSEAILDECFRSILAQRPDLKPSALDRTRELMRSAIPDCIVSGYEHLVEGLTLPDPDDRHVLAAAIRGGAQTIVTFNLNDFPTTTLGAYDIAAMHPDDFVRGLVDLASIAVSNVVQEQALRNPPQTTAELLDTLKKNGLDRSVSRLRELLGEP